MQGLQGARVLITGGAAGIGHAMALGFAAEGARVAICDRDPAALDAVRGDHPDWVVARADVTDEPAMGAVFSEALAEFGGLDVVAANAGTGGPAGAVEELDLAAWRACLSVNLDGAFLTAKLAAPVLKEQRAGLLLLTSSTAGLFGYPFRAPYAVAKWGVIGLMKTLAMELGPHGVRVNALCPGSVEGPRMDRVLDREAAARGAPIEEVREIYVKGVSLKTWVEAEDIANMALFLASDLGKKISGQAMAVDGHTETLGD